VVDIAEEIAVSPGVQYVFLVVDEVVGDLVLVWAVFGEEILSLVVHGVRHYVSCVLSDDCTIRNRCCRFKTYAGVIRWLEGSYVSFGVDRRTGFSVPTEGVHAVVSVADYGRGKMVA